MVLAAIYNYISLTFFFSLFNLIDKNINEYWYFHSNDNSNDLATVWFHLDVMWVFSCGSHLGVVWVSFGGM